MCHSADWKYVGGFGWGAFTPHWDLEATLNKKSRVDGESDDKVGDINPKALRCVALFTYCAGRVPTRPHLPVGNLEMVEMEGGLRRGLRRAIEVNKSKSIVQLETNGKCLASFGATANLVHEKGPRWGCEGVVCGRVPDKGLMLCFDRVASADLIFDDPNHSQV